MAEPNRARFVLLWLRRSAPAGTINVADQERDPQSLLSWMERLIRRRRETPEIVFGEWSLVPVPQPAVLALRYDWGSRTVLVVHNLAAKDQKVSFQLEPHLEQDGLIDLFGEGDFSVGKDGGISVTLEGYGFRWFRVRRSGKSTLG